MCDCKKDKQMKKDIKQLKEKIKSFEEKILSLLPQKTKDSEVDLTFKD